MQREGNIDSRAKLAFAACCVAAGALLPPERWTLLAALCAIPLSLLAAVRFRAPRSAFRIRAHRLLGLSPLVVLLAIGNPHGTLSGAARIVLMAALAILTAAALITTTPLAEIMAGLRRIGAPAPLVTQIGLLHRYLFVIRERAAESVAARALRDAGRGGRIQNLRAWGNLFGVLFARSLDQADRVAAAMQLRGFDGNDPAPETKSMRRADWLIVSAAVMLVIAAAAVARV